MQNSFSDKNPGSFIVLLTRPDILYPFGQNGIFQRQEIHDVNERLKKINSFQCLSHSPRWGNYPGKTYMPLFTCRVVELGMFFNVLHDGSPNGILFFPELIALLQCFLLFIQVFLREQSQGITVVCFAAHIGKDAVITHLKKNFGQQVDQIQFQTVLTACVEGTFKSD